MLIWRIMILFDDTASLASSIGLNDACLVLRGTYQGDIERHREVLRRLSNDLSSFVSRLRTVTDADDPRGDFFDF